MEENKYIEKSLIYRAVYKTTKNVGNNETIEADGYTSLRIYNSGDTTIYLNGLIPVAPGKWFELIEQPYVRQQANIMLTYDTLKGSVPQCVIMKTFYKPIY